MISGSRAALWIVVVPSAYTAAINRFSVRPDTREVERDLGAVQTIGERLEVAVAELERGAHRLQPRHVHVDRPGTEVVATRQREAHVPAAREQRAEHVDRRPDPFDQLIRRDRRQIAVVGEDRRAACRRRSIDRPIAPSRSAMIDTSTISGTLASSNDPSVSNVAAISFSTEFLAPGTTTSPAADRRGGRRSTVGINGSGSTAPVARRDRYPSAPVCSAGARCRSNGHSRLARRARRAAALEQPRDDLVLERASSPDGTFEQEDGPVPRSTSDASSIVPTADSSRRTRYRLVDPVVQLVVRASGPCARRSPVAPAAPPRRAAPTVVGAARPADRTPDASSGCSPRRR